MYISKLTKNSFPKELYFSPLGLLMHLLISKSRQGCTMNELVQIAQNVTKAVSSIVPFSISLSDEHGYLVGATDPERVGSFHPDSKKVINSGEYLSYEESEVVHMDNVLPGIAMPLVFERKTIGVIGVIGSPDEVRPYAELIKRYVELMWQESFHKQIEDLEGKIEETYLQYILLSESKSEAKISEYSSLLGLNANKQTFCIVIDIYDFLLKEMDEYVYSLTVNHLKQLILQEIIEVFHQPEIKKIRFLNTERIVLIVSVKSEAEYFSIMSQFKRNSEKVLHRLEPLDMKQVRIAAGSLSDSVYRLYESYQEAIFLLEYDTTEGVLEPILSLHDWEIVTAIMPAKIEDKFLERISFELSNLMKEKQYDELKASFNAYCENNMNVTKAAEALFIHRNTLIYRLNKIEKLSSVDMKSFQQCSVLYMALTRNFYA